MSQTHNISYNPEITEDISKEKHVKLHGHGTGRAKNTKGVPCLRIERVISINPNKPHGLYLPKGLVEEGFEGSVSLIDSPHTSVLLHPRASFGQVIESLSLILDKVKFRRRLAEKVKN